MRTPVMRDRVIPVLLGGYKYGLSPFLHGASGLAGACRFQPTCSEYAVIAVSEYGLARGGWMALRRLLRCHPFCRGGFDPVPADPPLHVMASSQAARPSHAPITIRRADSSGHTETGTKFGRD
jgi:uncharacterized protein